MKKGNRKLTWKDKAYWQQIKWEEVFKKNILPVIIASFLGIFLGYRIHMTIATAPKDHNKKISNTVDLPTQINLLQNTELTVLENTLSSLDNTDDNVSLSDNQTKEERLADTLAGLNFNNTIKDFLTAYLAINYNNLGDSSFSTILRFLPDTVQNLSDTVSSPSDSNGSTSIQDKTALQIQNNLLQFLNGDSWAKKTESQTSIAGTPIVSTLTGTNYNTRYYLVIVPATNELRDFANLSFVFKMDSNQKIIDVVYLGEVGYGITFKGVNQFYDNLATILDNNGDETNYEKMPENNN